MDWLAAEILGLDAWPPEVVHLFPFDVRDEAGLLWAVRGQSLEQHLERLRSRRTSSFVSLGRWTRPSIGAYECPHYDAAEGVAFHLTQHEAEHRS